MDDLHRADGWVPAVIAAIAGGWTMVKMFFNLMKRVDNNERDIAALKDISNEKFDEIKDEIHAVSDRTEKRHNSIEAKIDRLIERTPAR
jgi:hypothetical protein